MQDKMLKKSLITLSSITLAIVASYGIYETDLLYSKKVATFDVSLKEISGIEFDKNNNFWAINDGGDDPNLYQVNQEGEITKVITVTNAKNIDWEDMTQNDFGHFFLGDFGNNDNMRKWLTVYKIENPIDIKGNTTEAEIIKFTYPEQESYPPKPEDKRFDLEAFVNFNDNLYLFTKSRTAPFDGNTHLYRIGDHAANYQAKRISQFHTCTTHEKLCWITSAAISPDRTKLVLLDSQRLWLFENWQGDDFFSGDAYQIDLGIITQKEAVTFYDDNTVIFTDEEFQGIGRNAYVLKLDEVSKKPINNDE